MKKEDEMSDFFSSTASSSSNLKPRKSDLDQKLHEQKKEESVSSRATENTPPGDLNESQDIAQARPSASAEEASRKQANKSAMFTAASTAGQLITSANSAIDQNVEFAHAASEVEVPP